MCVLVKCFVAQVLYSSRRIVYIIMNVIKTNSEVCVLANILLRTWRTVVGIHMKSEAERIFVCIAISIAWQVMYSSRKKILGPLEASLLIGIKVLIARTLLIWIKV